MICCLSLSFAVILMYHCLCFFMLSFVCLYKGPSRDGHCKPARAINAVVCGTGSCCILVLIKIRN